MFEIIFCVIGIIFFSFAIICMLAVKRVIMGSDGTNEKIKISENILAVKKTGNKKEVIQ